MSLATSDRNRKVVSDKSRKRARRDKGDRGEWQSVAVPSRREACVVVVISVKTLLLTHLPLCVASAAAVVLFGFSITSFISNFSICIRISTNSRHWHRPYLQITKWHSTLQHPLPIAFKPRPSHEEGLVSEKRHIQRNWKEPSTHKNLTLAVPSFPRTTCCQTPTSTTNNLLLVKWRMFPTISDPSFKKDNRSSSPLLMPLFWDDVGNQDRPKGDLLENVSLAEEERRVRAIEESKPHKPAYEELTGAQIQFCHTSDYYTSEEIAKFRKPKKTSSNGRKKKEIKVKEEPPSPTTEKTPPPPSKSSSTKAERDAEIAAAVAGVHSSSRDHGSHRKRSEQALRAIREDERIEQEERDKAYARAVNKAEQEAKNQNPRSSHVQKQISWTVLELKSRVRAFLPIPPLTSDLVLTQIGEFCRSLPASAVKPEEPAAEEYNNHIIIRNSEDFSTRARVVKKEEEPDTEKPQDLQSRWKTVVDEGEQEFEEVKEESSSEEENEANPLEDEPLVSSGVGATIRMLQRRGVVADEHDLVNYAGRAKDHVLTLTKTDDPAPNIRLEHTDEFGASPTSSTANAPARTSWTKHSANTSRITALRTAPHRTAPHQITLHHHNSQDTTNY
ncbi:hypothetical protein Pelo_16622 [Pelomyxa schiedti]|nr:hypothetical protein Pelo_16622 [Pelomyxa schiedti]